MSTFESLPLEIRHQIYALLLFGSLLTSRGWHVLPPAPMLTEIHSSDKVSNELQPAIVSVSRQIHDEAASVLYGENRFFFLHDSLVERLKEWLDQVGSDNLRRIRKAAITLVPGGEPQLNGKQLFEVNRTFTLCLRKIITECTELQDLNIFECVDSNPVMMPASDHILALTRVTGLKRLCLYWWNSLYAAKQLVRLLGLREKSRAKVKKLLTSESHEPVVTYLHPRYHLLANKLEITDHATIDQAEKSWEEVEDLLKMELDT